MSHAKPDKAIVRCGPEGAVGRFSGLPVIYGRTT
jgi:hypothetical protein